MTRGENSEVIYQTSRSRRVVYERCTKQISNFTSGSAEHGLGGTRVPQRGAKVHEGHLRATLSNGEDFVACTTNHGVSGGIHGTFSRCKTGVLGVTCDAHDPALCLRGESGPLGRFTHDARNARRRPGCRDTPDHRRRLRQRTSRERQTYRARDGSSPARHADEALHRIQPFLHKLSGSIHGIHKDGEHLHGFRPSRKRRRRGDVAEISPELKLGIGDVDLVCLVLVLLADDPQVRPGRPDPVHNSLLGI